MTVSELDASMAYAACTGAHIIRANTCGDCAKMRAGGGLDAHTAYAACTGTHIIGTDAYK
eukprot:scaffold11801_cov23-Tisochrysis_lutea.AAC.2